MGTQRHKRSGGMIISLPFPTASTNNMFDNEGETKKSRGAANDGYSHLFTSGILQQHIQRQSSSPSCPTTPQIKGPFHPSADETPEKAASHSPTQTPARRQRSSILHTTPNSGSPRNFKAAGADNGVERALDNVMKTLKTMKIGTPRSDTYPSPQREESRWSSSSEESLAETEDSGFWRSRKSSESIRSRVTIGTIKSAKSVKSRKSRKSMDTDRLDAEEDVPPVPVAPVTPSRRKRMMEGLAKRLGFIPKKKIVEAPVKEVKEPVTPRLPRQSSLSTLRSVISKKTSTGTMRSFRSSKSSHPFVGTNSAFDCEAYPPLPRWREDEIGDSCLPMTPRRRAPKSSIGPPRLQPSTSPSQFLKDLPRRAPGTPRQDAPPVPDVLEAYYAPSPVKATTPSETFAVSLEEKLRRAAEAVRDAIPELSPGRFDTPRTEASLATPRSTSIATPRSHDTTLSPNSVGDTSFNTPPLTARAAQEAMKPKRLLNLLPKQSRINLGLQTPPRAAMRSKKSTDPRMVLGDKTNITLNVPTMNTPDSISSVLAKAGKRPAVCRPSAPTSSVVSKSALSVFRDSPSMPKEERSTTANSGGNEADRQGSPDEVTDPGTNVFEATFGKFERHRRSIPDWTASPDASFSGISFLGRISRRGSGASLESDLPTEEWELEAYLKELERVDQERAMLIGSESVS